MVMRARVGDRLAIEHDRIGVVIGVPAVDGSPPYVVKWLKDGNIALVQPDQYSRIVPPGSQSLQRPRARTGRDRARGRYRSEKPGQRPDLRAPDGREHRRDTARPSR